MSGCDAQMRNISEKFSHVKGFTAISILNLNIRSMNKNFYNFKTMLQKLNFQFSIICLSKTWCKDARSAENDSNLKIPGYNVIH